MKILFVCMGNICRSPTAHGLFQSMIRKEQLNEIIEIDSAGTHSWNIGNPPDISSQKTAKKHNVDISELRARPIVKEDYNYYNYIIAMDENNLSNMLIDCEDENRYKLKLLLEYADNTTITEVPDPYGGGMDGFESVYDLIEQGCSGLLRALQKEMTSKV